MRPEALSHINQFSYMYRLFHIVTAFISRYAGVLSTNFVLEKLYCLRRTLIMFATHVPVINILAQCLPHRLSSHLLLYDFVLLPLFARAGNAVLGATDQLR